MSDTSGMKRPIKTTFYRGNELIRVNSARWANNAVPNAVGHMQIDQYNSTHCEVYDAESGELHAVIKKKVNGIDILFKREIVEGM